jgi:hypothetical protein
MGTFVGVLETWRHANVEVAMTWDFGLAVILPSASAPPFPIPLRN